MRIPSIAGLVGLTLLAGCVPRAEPPLPTPAARPIPVPTPRPVAPPAPPRSADWRDWAAAPGTWRYAPDTRGGRASFGSGTPVLTLICDRAGGTVRVMRAGVAATAMTVRTSTSERTLAAQTVPGGVEAVLPASDRLLDAMGFSRGRFVVETPGAPALVVPAWAEVLRVVEECR